MSKLNTSVPTVLAGIVVDEADKPLSSVEVFLRNLRTSGKQAVARAPLIAIVTPRTSRSSAEVALPAASLSQLVRALKTFLLELRLPGVAPFGAVLDDPIGQRPLKSDIASDVLGFNPLVIRSLGGDRRRFTMDGGVWRQAVGGMGGFRFVNHNGK
jgi:hypothetical protein